MSLEKEKGKETAPCGVSCWECPEYHKSCSGCMEGKGRPSWVSYIGKEVCPLYQCPVEEHGYQTCGECGKLPCEKFLELRDPSWSDEEFEQSIKNRLAVLKQF